MACTQSPTIRFVGYVLYDKLQTNPRQIEPVEFELNANHQRGADEVFLHERS